jgi:adenosylmethionine-8-amino-7-oxononanoate aminotransferase
MNDRPNSAASRDVAYHLHPYTNARKNEAEGPMVMTKGKGIYVYDENGKEYIEGLAGLWCAGLGFGEERLVEAATRQMRALPYYHAFAQKAPAPSVDLAEKLIGLAPVPMSKAFFANSGSEANDTALKIVWSARAQEDHLASPRLPRRHHRGGQPHPPALRAAGLRPAGERPLPADRLPALLPLGPRRRERS